ncbi:MAG: hypothetical protein U1F77_04275 [Kiritimatiellia bacterium]
MRIRDAGFFRAVLLALTLLAAGCSRNGVLDAKSADAKAEKMWARIGDELARAAGVLKPPKIVLVRTAVSIETGAAPDHIEAAFRKRIGRVVDTAPALETLAVPETPRPPDAPASLLLPRRVLDPVLLADAAGRAGAGGLVVSLMGEPVPPPEPGAAIPPVVCFSAEGAAGLARQIRAGSVVAAVAPRHTNPAPDEDDWYELRYTVVDRTTVDAWLP